MSEVRQLDEQTLVSGQIQPGDVAGLVRDGVTMIVNNRPDDEDAGQPRSADIEAAAHAAGIAYRHIPIRRGIGPSDVEAMGEAIDELGDGKMLAFCRSGNRSTLVWAVARYDAGVPREKLEECAAGAGVSLGPVAHLL
ncbi:MAG TPA: TIGR01244 family sulfur transferase [Sphingomicrobium sp.]